MNDQPIAYTVEGRPLYDNTPSVVCVAVQRKEDSKILVITRNTEPGKGKLALPGGYHMRGESWQECGAREVKEEVGLDLNPEWLMLEDVITDSYGNNLFMVSYLIKNNDITLDINFDEVQNANFLNQRQIEEGNWAFPLHKSIATMLAKWYWK